MNKKIEDIILQIVEGGELDDSSALRRKENEESFLQSMENQLSPFKASKKKEKKEKVDDADDEEDTKEKDDTEKAKEKEAEDVGDYLDQFYKEDQKNKEDKEEEELPPEEPEESMPEEKPGEEVPEDNIDQELDQDQEEEEEEPKKKDPDQAVEDALAPEAEDDGDNKVDPEDIVNKINVLRSGRSAKDAEVYKQIVKYLSRLHAQEKVALNKFLDGLVDVLVRSQLGDESTIPSDAPNPIKMSFLSSEGNSDLEQESSPEGGTEESPTDYNLSFDDEVRSRSPEFKGGQDLPSDDVPIKLN